ncbi:MAG: AAA family ATPase [candidate division Zixibacteria bacterium]|nr:AAA family ATPase [candidate division Zixibacteria bacterium]
MYNSRLRPEYLTPSTTSPASIISVLSGKGGVGKSVVSLNLAERLASSGSRVLLVDANFFCGNLHILANCSLSSGVQNVMLGSADLQFCVWPLSESLALLGSSPTTPREEITSHDVVRLLNILRKDSESLYDFVIVDHGSGVSDTATLMAHGSDLNILVLIPELTSIADAYGLFKFLTESKPKLNSWMLINRVVSADEAEHIRERFDALTERFLGKSVGYLGYLSDDLSVKKGIGAQKTISQIEGSNLILSELTHIAARLSAICGKAAISQWPESERINKSSATAEIKE